MFSYILKAYSTLSASESSYHNPGFGSIWMNLRNVQRNSFTQIKPLIAPMNLCPPKGFGVVSSSPPIVPECTPGKFYLFSNDSAYSIYSFTLNGHSVTFDSTVAKNVSTTAPIH